MSELFSCVTEASSYPQECQAIDGFGGWSTHWTTDSFKLCHIRLKTSCSDWLQINVKVKIKDKILSYIFKNCAGMVMGIQPTQGSKTQQKSWLQKLEELKRHWKITERKFTTCGSKKEILSKLDHCKTKVLWGIFVFSWYINSLKIRICHSKKKPESTFLHSDLACSFALNTTE